MFAPGTLEAFGLVLVRTGAMVMYSPLFGMGTNFPGAKLGIVVTCSIVIYLSVGVPLGEETSVLMFGALAVRELLIGLFMGFLFQAIFLAVRMGGELIGHEMGMFMAKQVDPESGASFTLVSKVYENFFVLGLLAVNGHHLAIRALADSFERAPVGSMTATGNLGLMAREIVGEMFGAGLAFAAPIMIFLMLVSILIGLLSRAVPHLNVLELSFTLRVGLAMVAMYFFAPMLEPALNDLYGRFARWFGTTLDVLGGL